MPFTPAHTAAVLPWVRRQGVSSTALIAGSMSPDFEYFIRMDVLGIWGHDLAGIFIFDLPVTLAIVALFHLVVKNNFINNLPAFLQQRVGHLKNLTFHEDVLSRPLTFALCATGGALTHVVWDSFTHGQGFFVKYLSWLYEGRFLEFDGARYPLWYVLQHVSTAVGLTILLVYVIAMKRSDKVVKPGIWYWIGLTVIAAIAVFARYQFPHTMGTPMLVITIISGLCIGVVILGLLPSRKEIANE